MSASSWQSNVTFTERYASLQKVSSALRNKCPDLDAHQLTRQAADIETAAFEGASSKADYEQECDAITSGHSPRLDDLDFLTDLPLPPASVAIGRYTHAQHHRDGLFSEVFKARADHDDADLVALKVTTPSIMTAPHNSEREARILADAKSDHVIPLIDTFSITGGRFILVFPFMPMDFEGALASGRLSEVQAKSYMRDMFAALHHLHSNGIIHRDIKPSNLLLKSAEGPAYLADFGIAWSTTDPASESPDKKITDVGTTCYRPPELLFGNSFYDCSLDLWAAGCVLAEALRRTNKTLFDSGELGSDLALIVSIFSSLGTPDLETWPEAAKLPDWGKMTFKVFPMKPWSELMPSVTDMSALDLLGQLVVYQSTNRVPADKALQHAYFKDA